MNGFDLALTAGRNAIRAELGFGDSDAVCVATVGGSGVGEALLRRLIEAYTRARETVGQLRMILVAGPRIDPADLPTRLASRCAATWTTLPGCWPPATSA